MNAPLAREELTGDAFFQDPYPYYERLRASAEPFWLSHTQDTSRAGVLMFSRYSDALAVFTSAQGISKTLRRVRTEGTRSAFDMHMLHRDGADHLRLRRLVSDWFSALAIRQLEPVMRAVARELVAPLQTREFDLVADFAEPLPLAIIARLVGVPAEGMPQIRAWSLVIGDGFDSLLTDPALLARQRQALGEFLAYVEGLIDARQAQPDASLLGFLIQQDATRLDREELVAMVGFLLYAGHETTVSLIGSAAWLLLSHPEQWAWLRADKTLLPGAVEEVLRFESPEQRSSFRLVDAPLVLNGHALEPGQQIGVIIGSANRDEAVFDHADTFDIRRNPNAHLAFGTGIHNCLGKTLARVETQVALQVLLEHLPHAVLRDANPRWRKNSFFRGLSALALAPD